MKLLGLGGTGIRSSNEVRSATEARTYSRQRSESGVERSGSSRNNVDNVSIRDRPYWR